MWENIIYCDFIIGSPVIDGKTVHARLRSRILALSLSMAISLSFLPAVAHYGPKGFHCLI